VVMNIATPDVQGFSASQSQKFRRSAEPCIKQWQSKTAKEQTYEFHDVRFPPALACWIFRATERRNRCCDPCQRVRGTATRPGPIPVVSMMRG